MRLGDVIRLEGRVEHFVIFARLVFAISSRILRILMEHKEIKNSLDSKLQTFSICSVEILNILKLSNKRGFQKYKTELLLKKEHLSQSGQE